MVQEALLGNDETPRKAHLNNDEDQTGSETMREREELLKERVLRLSQNVCIFCVLHFVCGVWVPCFCDFWIVMTVVGPTAHGSRLRELNTP